MTTPLQKFGPNPTTAESKYTVAYRRGPGFKGHWFAEDHDRVMFCLHPDHLVFVEFNPQHDGVMIIHGEFSEEQLRMVDTENVEFEVVEGWDNPKLPFRPMTPEHFELQNKRW